ncbi:plasma membrane heat shock protein [Rhodotorula toruloides]
MHREVFKRYTSSISTNPVTSNIVLSRPGSNWAWARFDIFALSMLTLGVVAHSRLMRHRAFHYIGLAILAATALHWATQASNLGTRYLGWAVTWLLLVLLATGFNLSRIFVVLFFALFSMWGGESLSLWMYYVFAVSSLFCVVWHLLHPAPRSARRLRADRGRVIKSAGLALGCSSSATRPIVWGLCEYGNVLTVSSEMFRHGVLDFLTRVVWLFAFLFALEGLAYERFGFHPGKGTDGANYRGSATGTSVAGNQGARMRSTNGGGGPASTGAGTTDAETATGGVEPAGAGRRHLNDDIGSGAAAPNARGDNLRETV